MPPGSSFRVVNFRTTPTPSPSGDITPVTAGNSGTSNGNGQFTPLGVTTVSGGALAVSIVTVNTVSGTLTLSSTQSFTLHFQEEPFGTSQVGFATRSVATPAAVTFPTYDNSDSNDAWTAISDALRP